jgi:hypothetical protein
MTHGGSAPGPYRQREARTLFLRVPYIDWTKVKVGEKTEFRTAPHESSKITMANTPTPVVAYATNDDFYDAKLMVLEARRHEPLWEIANDFVGLAREGYAEDYEGFRRYWRKRQKGVYKPLQMVWVWQVTPFLESDIIVEGSRLLRRLYGEFLPNFESS